MLLCCYHYQCTTINYRNTNSIYLYFWNFSSIWIIFSLSFFFLTWVSYIRFLCGSVSKESARNVKDLGLIPGLGRSLGEGKGYSLQYSGLENSMDCIVYGAAKSQTWLSDFHFHILEKMFSLKIYIKTKQLWHAGRRNSCVTRASRH